MTERVYRRATTLLFMKWSQHTIYGENIDIMRWLIAWACLLHMPFGLTENKAHPPPQINAQKTIEVAIIIDDMGYSKKRGLVAINIPGKLTYAFIPNSPNARFLADEANKRDKEIILHAPMSNVHNYPVGRSGLTEVMDKDTFTHALNSAIESIPHISGMNNHMGSLLTQKRLPMKWTMETLDARGLYFIDSRTTSHSVAWLTAQHNNVPSLKRDIFLDHKRETKFIAGQFEQLVRLAKRKGYAIAIAHPYPETLSYLQQHIHRLADEGITLVSASSLVNKYSPNRRQVQAKM
ncbi:MAG: divergent polysaccharide deacetylase family protein [Pseudomonadota bacterium]